MSKKLIIIVLALLAVSTNAATAKVDKTCVRNAMKQGSTLIDAVNMCGGSSQYTDYEMKRGAIGWHCDSGEGVPYRAPGGAKRKSDVVCE
jgi:hypothetical protein